MRFECFDGSIAYINIRQIKTLAERDTKTTINCGDGVFEIVKGTPAEIASDIARCVAEASR